jgi:hypothetical protein
MIGTRVLRLLWATGLVAATTSCEATPVAIAPAAQQVQIAKADPPRGSREIGPIEAIHGEGCGGFGAKGSYESALAVLRNKAAAMGGNYVELMTLTEPHSEHGCYDDRFIIRGNVYRVGDAPPEAPVAKAAPPPDSCSPPCSPGYACSAGVCLAQCNPACAANEVCRQDRTCGPAPH